MEDERHKKRKIMEGRKKGVGRKNIMGSRKGSMYVGIVGTRGGSEKRGRKDKREK